MDKKIQSIFDKHFQLFTSRLYTVFPKIRKVTRVSDIIQRWKQIEHIKLDTKTNLYVHQKTGLIFDPVTHRVIGKINNDKFSYDDIELCHKYKFDYDMPLSLDCVSISKQIDNFT